MYIFFFCYFDLWLYNIDRSIVINIFLRESLFYCLIFLIIEKMFFYIVFKFIFFFVGYSFIMDIYCYYKKNR